MNRNPTSAPVRHLLRLCRAEACRSKGGEQTIEHVEKRLGIKLGGTTEVKSLTLQAIYCLGNCTLSPSVMLDGKVYGLVTPQVADFLLDEVRENH